MITRWQTRRQRSIRAVKTIRAIIGLSAFALYLGVLALTIFGIYRGWADTMATVVSGADMIGAVLALSLFSVLMFVSFPVLSFLLITKASSALTRRLMQSNGYRSGTCRVCGYHHEYLSGAIVSMCPRCDPKNHAPKTETEW